MVSSHTIDGEVSDSFLVEQAFELSKLLFGRGRFVFGFDVVTSCDNKVEVFRAIFVSVSFQIVDGLEHMILPLGVLHVSKTSNNNETPTIL